MHVTFQGGTPREKYGVFMIGQTILAAGLKPLLRVTVAVAASG